MKLSAISALALVFCVSHSPAAQIDVKSVCKCPSPPGGSVECEGGWAVCVIENKECKAVCSKSKTVDPKQTVLEFIGAVTQVSPQTLGFDSKGGVLNRANANAALSIAETALDRGRTGEVTVPDQLRSVQIQEWIKTDRRTRPEPRVGYVMTPATFNRMRAGVEEIKRGGLGLATAGRGR